MALRQSYWRDTPEARREALLPFVWTVMAKQGQIFGNREKSSDAYVSNDIFFSYPGYSETLCGFPDDRIKSNDKIPNPNVTVFEWLDQKPGFTGTYRRLRSLGRLPRHLQLRTRRIPSQRRLGAIRRKIRPADLALINQLETETPRFWPDEPFDALPFHTALEYLKSGKPPVLFIGLGETDEWAHGGRYADYLDSAHRVDAYLRILWETVQSIARVSRYHHLIFSPDHGRGSGTKKWRDHGEKIPEARYIWMAFLGPDTQPFGERPAMPPSLNPKSPPLSQPCSAKTIHPPSRNPPNRSPTCCQIDIPVRKFRYTQMNCRTAYIFIAFTCG